MSRVVREEGSVRRGGEVVAPCDVCAGERRDGVGEVVRRRRVEAGGEGEILDRSEGGLGGRGDEIVWLPIQ